MKPIIVVRVGALHDQEREHLEASGYTVVEVHTDPQSVQLGPTATLRDQFAMAALPGIIMSNGDFLVYSSEWAVNAYKCADAMLEARKVQP